ncbi:MAG: HAD family hydrolase [Holosporales bacterium]
MIIFDCDGVLVDSEIIANRIDAEILSDLGYAISTEESIKKFTGMNTATVRDMIFQESGIVLPENLTDLAQRRVLSAFENELQTLIPQVLEYCSSMLKCVASSSPRARVLKSLELTKQDHFFSQETIFTSSQVKRGKPFPDLFLFAAQQMGISPENCLVIEDSVAGIKAAQSAGMAVIGFLGGSHAGFEWYRDEIQSLGVPIALHATDLINLLGRYIVPQDNPRQLR